jgi:carbamoyltransferase
MNILGIHIGHDSCAALVLDGRVVADVAEERFKRVKHYAGLPVQSIHYCLASQGLSFDDLDVVALAGKELTRYHRFLLNLDRGSDPAAPGGAPKLAKFLTGEAFIKPPLYLEGFHLRWDKTELVNVEHHLAHAASACYTSGTSAKQLIVTIDGAGDHFSTCIWRGEGNTITALEKFPTSGSLGWFYGNVTEALGWWHGDGEGKTMGLAPYGNALETKGVLDSYYPKYETGKLVRPHDFGRAFLWNEDGSLHWHFEDAREIKKLVDRFGAPHIAAEAQRVLEEQVFQIVFPWMERENTQNLSCAGGVFLNVKLNQRIRESRKVAMHHVYPNAGDAGLAAGAALHAWFSKNPGAAVPVVDNLYLGPGYGDEEISALLKSRNLKYRKPGNVIEEVARALASGRIVAWFQGRMESGPRALGNRSILMSPIHAVNKDILNARVKFREPFRPFCPSILYEKREDYLVNAGDEPFMITSYGCVTSKRAAIPAVVHADFTLRPQLVKKECNPKFRDLIHAFGTLTGEYVLLNTSMNIMGEPIVNHPREAIRCFFDSGIDLLVMNDYILEK